MIKLPGYFTGFSSKSDGSASLKFATQELTPEEFANFQRHHNAFGWVIFSEQEDEEIPSEQIEEEGITASERLRRRMFVYWKSKKIETEFETWRKQMLETWGSKLLDQI